MMERVSVKEGSIPALLIAPHGADDDFTAEMTEAIADEIGAYAVINWGWERSEKFDYFADKANCNNVSHLFEDVVTDEFLSPIEKYVSRILSEHHEAFIYLIHGCGNDARKISADPALDLIIGYGGAKNKRYSSYSSDRWRADAFGYLAYAQGFGTYFASEGGRFAGNSKNNLNQYYRKHCPDPSVHSLQVEVVKDKRLDTDTAKVTGICLSMAIEDHVDFMTEAVNDNGSYNLPIDWDVDWEMISAALPKY